MIPWPLVFGLALVADIVSTVLATRRGLTEGNPILRLRNPVIVMIALSALIVAPAEVCRALGAQGVDLIYAGGAAPHLVASLINGFHLMRRK